MDYEQLARRHTERLEEVEDRLRAVEALEPHVDGLLFDVRDGEKGILKRLEALEHRVEGTGEGDPFIVPLVSEQNRIEEQCRGWYMELRDTFASIDMTQMALADGNEHIKQACQERDEELRTRIAELEETIANLVTILEGQKVQLDKLLQDAYYSRKEG